MTTATDWPPDGVDWYYSDDYAAIAHGDCREILPLLPKVDLVLTDPPYGIDAGDQRRQLSRGKLALAADYGPNDWDKSPVNWGLLWELLTLGEWSICFGGNYYPMPPSACWLVWDKDNTGDFADCEMAWTSLPGAVRLKKYRWNGMLQEPGQERNVRQHPTQKPVQVMKWCLDVAMKKTSPDSIMTILDPFMGSGTTLRAAKDLQRRCIGIEIEEEYCEIAARRLAQEVLAL